MPRPHRILKEFKKIAKKGTKKVPIYELAHEVHRVADQMKRRSSIFRRFLLGIVFGLGTAIGASVIATLAILFLREFLHSLGIDIAP